MLLNKWDEKIKSNTFNNKMMIYHNGKNRFFRRAWAKVLLSGYTAAAVRVVISLYKLLRKSC